MSASLPRHILIVDDDLNLAQLLAKTLDDRSGRYEFFATLDPFQAIERAQQHPVDLLITDFAMPQMNGLQLIDSIRQTSPGMSVIMMTAYNTGQLLETASTQGIETLLPKPFTLSDIRQVVDGVLARIDRVKPTPPASEEIQLELFRQVSRLVDDTGARCALLLQTDGNVVEMAGDLKGLDVSVMAALMAANFAAVTEIARLMGNPRSFDAINHESKEDNIYSCAVGTHHLLVVIFGLSIKPGAVWYYTKKAVEPLIELLQHVNTSETQLPADFGVSLDNTLLDLDLSSPVNAG